MSSSGSVVGRSVSRFRRAGIFGWLAFGIGEADISELGFKLLKMPPGRRVDDDGLIPAGALHFSNAVAESLEPKAGLRCTEVYEQLVAFGIGHGNCQSHRRLGKHWLHRLPNLLQPPQQRHDMPILEHSSQVAFAEVILANMGCEELSNRL